MNADAVAQRLMEVQKAQSRVRSALRSVSEYFESFGCIPQDRIDELQQAANAFTLLVLGDISGT